MSFNTGNLEVAHRDLINRYLNILNIIEGREIINFSTHPCSNIFRNYVSLIVNDINSSLNATIGNSIFARFIALILKIVVFGFLFFSCVELWIISLVIAKLPLINKFSLFLTVQSVKLHMVVKIKYLKKLYEIAYLQSDDKVLLDKIEQCKQLNSQFDLSGFFIIFNNLGKFLVSLGIFNGLSSLFKNSEMLERILLSSVILVVLLPFILFPFICKRVLLIRNNAYHLENELFRIIKTNNVISREDPQEWQWDFLIYIANYAARHTLVLSVLALLSENKTVWGIEDPVFLILAVVCFSTLFMTRKYENYYIDTASSK